LVRENSNTERPFEDRQKPAVPKLDNPESHLFPAGNPLSCRRRGTVFVREKLKRNLVSRARQA